jgi:heme-degrading monooxygenase HmoA
VRENPPAGLIVHVMTETANGVHVVDVWESQADFDRFSNSQLMPTMQKVMAERHISMDGPPPEPTFEEAFDVVRSR